LSVRVIGVGDNTVDQYCHLGLMFPGGNAVNVPVLAHRYGHPASYLGWLGADRPGRLILQALGEEGVDTSRCRVIEGPNAFCEVSQVDGERVFGRSDHGVTRQISLNAADLEFVRRHDVAHTSIYSHIEAQLESLSQAARRLSFDFSRGPSRAYLVDVLPCIYVAFVSCAGWPEAATGDLVRWMQAQGPEVVVATRGHESALATDGRQMIHQDVVEVKEVVDTLGAGDAFAARFLIEYLGGADIRDALAAAAAAAAETCGYLGAFGRGAPI
jgi:fructoselysine 6-kinase